MKYGKYDKNNDKYLQGYRNREACDRSQPTALKICTLRFWGSVKVVAVSVWADSGRAGLQPTTQYAAYKVTGPVTEVYMDSAALAYLVVRAAKN
jgi:hypothetical protein